MTLPAYLTDIHFLDLTTCDGPCPNARTGCDRSTHNLNRSTHREKVDCPECLESEAFKAQGMEEALVPRRPWIPPTSDLFAVPNYMPRNYRPILSDTPIRGTITSSMKVKVP